MDASITVEAVRELGLQEGADVGAVVKASDVMLAIAGRPSGLRALGARTTLTTMGLARPAATVPSRSGPQRTVLEATPTGKRALTRWLRQPIAHVRDARSLLMLKLLFLTRREADVERLLSAQRARTSPRSPSA